LRHSLLRDAEVREQRTTRAPVEQDIVGLEIAVNDAGCVSIVQRTRELAENMASCLEVQCTVAPKLRLKRFAGDESHDEVEERRGLPEGVERDDVRVREPRCSAGFAQEAFPGVSSGGEIGGKDLDRDVAVEEGLVRKIDAAHPSMANEAYERVLRAERRREQNVDDGERREHRAEGS